MRGSWEKGICCASRSTSGGRARTCPHHPQPKERERPQYNCQKTWRMSAENWQTLGPPVSDPPGNLKENLALSYDGQQEKMAVLGLDYAPKVCAGKGWSWCGPHARENQCRFNLDAAQEDCRKETGNLHSKCIADPWGWGGTMHSQAEGVISPAWRDSPVKEPQKVQRVCQRSPGMSCWKREAAPDTCQTQKAWRAYRSISCLVPRLPTHPFQASGIRNSAGKVRKE